MRGILLDTCAAIRLANGDPMSAASREAIAKAQARSLGIFVSPISAWEVAVLAAKCRIRLSMDVETWFENLLAISAWPRCRRRSSSHRRRCRALRRATQPTASSRQQRGHSV